MWAMTPLLKYILEIAFNYSKSFDQRDATLDTIYTKMVVSPIQRAWRKKRSCFNDYD